MMEHLVCPTCAPQLSPERLTTEQMRWDTPQVCCFCNEVMTHGAATTEEPHVDLRCPHQRAADAPA